MSERAYPPLSGDMSEFVRLLGVHRVEYLLVGGWAVFLHGYPRATGDADFAYRREAENCVRLYQALREFWGGEVPAVSCAAELEQEGVVVQFGRPPNRIDLLSGAAGLDFGEAWSRRIVVPAPGDGELIVCSLRDLRAMKLAAGRPRDADDLENLPLHEGDEG